MKPLADDLLGQSRVLIVDDQAENVRMLERLLGAAGVGVIEGFTDPAAGLDRCLRESPDIVLLDLHMPGLDGFTVLDRLRSNRPRDGFLPVLVLTGDADAATRRQALAAGAKDFVTKPFDATEVVLRVRNLLETKDLYTRLERHNARLRAELDAELAARRRDAEQLDVKARRVAEILRDGLLSVVYQPIVSLADGRLLGAEALARFLAEPRRPPNEWFAEAESVGRGVELELHAVACAMAGLDQLPGDVYLSVNASALTSAEAGLRTLLAACPGNRIVLELTEHTRVGDYEALLTSLDHCRSNGVRIAADDTGAGYAGLQHLLRLRPDVIKLDVELTRSIDADPARRALASALVTFAAEIGASLVAEGVETVDELRALRMLGITAGQGYRLARPGPLSTLRASYRDTFTDILE